MYRYILQLILLLSITANPQVRITVNNNFAGAVLYSLSGENVSFIDSLESENGTFNFNVPHPGFYRLSLTSNKWIDFIYDDEEIWLITDFSNIPDSLKVIKSESNKLYYKFVQLNRNYKTKSELLQLIIARYPKDDDFYGTSQAKLKRVQDEYLNFINITAQKSPASFTARYIKSAQLPVIDALIPPESQLEYLKTHDLDNVNFNDPDLIYSDAFTNKTIEYLTYYRNPQMPVELLEKEFQSAIDTVLNKAKVNELVYKHVTEYLLDGFKKFGFDNVINYIVDNYVIKDEICLDEKLGDTIDRRIQQNRNFKPGSSVPDISLTDPDGSLVKLSKIESERTLIIFYASWCPHCQTLLPQIYERYKKQSYKKFEVLAVSIDSSSTEWLNFINKNDLDWLNVSDLKGWEGKPALDYYIYATPTMFLVDQNLKLLVIPNTLDEIN